jgi:urease accessory protein
LTDLALDVHEFAPSEPVATHPPGSGSICVERVGPRCVVTHAFATSPLRLLMPRNHGNSAWIYTSTYGGGLVDGDAVGLDISVGEGARMLLATQAATKVYRSPCGTSVECAAAVRTGGLLVAAPDPVVCFAGSFYRQRQTFDLEGTAGLVCVDWFSSGRHATGERWQFDCYQSRIAVRRNSRLVMVDAISLDKKDGNSAGNLAQRMDRFEVMLMAAVFGPSLERYAAELVSRVNALPVTSRADLLIGASAIPGEGCVLRMAGISVENVGRAARDYLSFVPALLGDDPWSRKW